MNIYLFFIENPIGKLDKGEPLQLFVKANTLKEATIKALDKYSLKEECGMITNFTSIKGKDGVRSTAYGISYTNGMTELIVTNKFKDVIDSMKEGATGFSIETENCIKLE